MELTILMPCLNEAETLDRCITNAFQFLRTSGICGEVVVADNGSTDGSPEIARRLGARVVEVPGRGYGAALNGGIAAAKGTYVIMGDADASYDFSNLGDFVESLRSGNDLVMGNRFAGGIEDGAMPWHHRWIGNPVLSWVGRLFFRIPVRDFHCGLRGFKRERVVDLGLHTTGMEWASELVVASAFAGLKISEVPTTLAPDGRSRPPHLRSFHDGWRHLRFLLLYSPRWLFLYPGILMFSVGLGATAALTIGPVEIGGVGLDIGTLLLAVSCTIVGYLALWFAVISRDFAAREGFLPSSPRSNFVKQVWSLERGLFVGTLLLLIGGFLTVVSFLRWRAVGYGALDGAETIRTVAPAVLGLVLGTQTISRACSGRCFDYRFAADSGRECPAPPQLRLQLGSNSPTSQYAVSCSVS